MTNKDFIEKSFELVKEYSSKKNLIKVEDENIFIVWNCYTLGNIKALLGTHISDSRYYEVTYNKERNEIYFDSYVKEHNECIK